MLSWPNIVIATDGTIPAISQLPRTQFAQSPVLRSARVSPPTRVRRDTTRSPSQVTHAPLAAAQLIDCALKKESSCLAQIWRRRATLDQRGDLVRGNLNDIYSEKWHLSYSAMVKRALKDEMALQDVQSQQSPTSATVSHEPPPTARCRDGNLTWWTGVCSPEQHSET